MRKIDKRVLTPVCALIIFFLMAPLAVEQERDNDGIPQRRILAKQSARLDEAIGVMTKGQLCNLTMNYGQISDTRLEDPGNNPSDDFFNFRYPKSKPYGSMVDDFALIFAIERNSKNSDNGNVIDGYTNNGNEDWIAKDGSLGKTHYDGSGETPMLLYVDGTTPYLGHSDLPQTWPLDENDVPFWPGYYRRNPETGEVFPGEFASDRDVYAVFTDNNNQQGDVVGLEIEMMAYCYGRTYAEDFQFYEFFLHNTSGDTIKAAWFGYYIDPDCSDYGQETLIVPAGYSFSDTYTIIMQRDSDGDLNAATNPNNVGRVEDMDFGVIILETPRGLGVTDFHYFTDSGPTFDEDLWPIITSDPNDPDIATSYKEYFHGANRRVDDVSTIEAKDWVYIAATGPFDFPPDDTLKYTIAVVAGDTDADFMKNCEMAVQMFEKGFVGPSAPPGPQLFAVPGDGRVTLYWDNSSELKPDPLSGELDFEGYKIYRSEDNGVTWGDEITDSHGNVVGYVPLVQYDLEDQIQGDDPINPNNYLGSDTGLRYTYVDSTVYNGIIYSYTITAYDRGDPDAQVPSFETAKGVGIAEKHFVTVTPRPDPLAYIPSEIGALRQVSGKGVGTIAMEVFDFRQYEIYKDDNDYTAPPLFKITFEGFPATHFSLYDSTANLAIRRSLALNDEIAPVISELGLKVSIFSQQKIGGIERVTDELGSDLFGPGKADHTNSWYVTAGDIPTASLDARSNSYELRFTSGGSMAYSKQRDPVAIMAVPFEVWRLHPDTVQIICLYDDVNLNRIFEQDESVYIGNVTYLSTTPVLGDSIKVVFPNDFPVQIKFKEVPPDTLNPEGGRLPTEGQKVVISCFSSYSDGSGFTPGSESFKGDMLLFSVQDASVDSRLVADRLSEIRVVPNPYVVNSLFDPRENVHSIKFMYLPEECTINIYSLAGVKVKVIHHQRRTGVEDWDLLNEDGTGIESWDLTNEFGQDIAFGVYVYVVTTPEGEKKTGKVAIIK